jgi:hypothetical protein
VGFDHPYLCTESQPECFSPPYTNLIRRLTECLDAISGSTGIANGDKSYPRDFRWLLRFSWMDSPQGKANQQQNSRYMPTVIAGRGALVQKVFTSERQINRIGSGVILSRSR